MLFFHVWLGVEPVLNALIASALALTSLSVVLRCVVDLGMVRSPEGMNLLSMTILNEFVGLLVASIALEFLLRPEVGGLITLLLRVVVFFALAGVVGYFAVPSVIKAVERAFKVKEASFATLVALILLFSYLATRAGLHGALGALTLGFALSRARDDPVVSRTVGQLKGFAHGIFIPIFFAGAGLYVTREFLFIDPLAAAMIALIVPAGKLFGGYVGSRILPIGARSPAVTFGLLAKGGVELAILPLAVEMGALSTELYSFAVLLIVAMTVAASALLNFYGVKAREMVTAAESPPDE
jgi:Kef-type K+ transport system membrane component KefB